MSAADNRGTERLFSEKGTGGGEIVPAATVVLLRDDPAGGPPETLMLRKNRGQAFGGMWVFPGGRVEPGDGDTAADGELAVARNAAVREAAEETGVVLDPASLVFWSHWIPPPEAPRRFSTWFFVAALPPAAAEVVVDGGEIGDHVWTVPAAALARHRDGEVELAPPTWVTLDSLAGHADAAAVLAAGRAAEPPFFETRVCSLDGDLVLLWAGDAGYEAADPTAPGARHRLVTAAAGWRYERG